jgi:5-formyltetrahydrofolate cyclo-ligase
MHLRQSVHSWHLVDLRPWQPGEDDEVAHDTPTVLVTHDPSLPSRQAIFLVNISSSAVLPDARTVKRSMRERIRAERRRRAPGGRAAEAQGVAEVALELPEIASARCVAAYSATPTSPGTLALRDALRAHGVRVLLPVLLDDGRLDWSPDGSPGVPPLLDDAPDVDQANPDRTNPDGAPGLDRATDLDRATGTWASGPAGQPGPDGIGSADVVIIPALAVDTLGNRLGLGAGFYDRALRTIDPGVSVFAVVYENEVLDAAVEPVPAEPHDRPVDAVITPHRCLRLPPRR